jgi:hypothetical protein
MRAALIAVVCLAACGRRGFDPPGTAGGDDTVDPDAVTGNGDGPEGGTAIDASPLIDASSSACVSSTLITLGRTGPTSTCTLPDRVDSCGPAGRQEVIFKFIAPSTASYTFGAYTPGTQNISNSTQILDATCTLQPGCAALTGRSFTAGQVLYFVVEASTTVCTMIEFSITSP